MSGLMLATAAALPISGSAVLAADTAYEQRIVFVQPGKSTNDGEAAALLVIIVSLERGQHRFEILLVRNQILVGAGQDDDRFA